ncbi:ciliary microtubule inner protein 1-like [Ruditapes philippinarum]|uniref:ciliary microtubule inner protein 1-like n=1 Tax=Ruditapes philippinarum TaxID=129788 RepID=UPI00295A8115|nr:ciliary microtubule inner protein 1-like [Ruditapes philippinarum]
MAENSAGKRLSKILNMVQSDEIWKDHVRRENVTARQIWPETWGYLVYEYKMLNCKLAGDPPLSRPQSNQTPETLKLPVIPKKRAGFPSTTSQGIGWTSAKNTLRTQMVTSFGEQKRGKCSIQRRFKWPHDAV